MSFITAIGTSSPVHCFSQRDIGEFMIRSMGLDPDQASRTRALFRATGIETRHSVIGDYGKTDAFDFFSNTPDGEPFPSTPERMKLFQTHANSLSLASIEPLLDQDRRSYTHLIVVSCTGMYAPGLDIDLVKSLGLSTNIHRTSITFMGCYAAFNALKLADAFCKSQADARVIVVCTELCSIHFQKERSEDNLLANALFADGSAAMVIENNPRSLALEIQSFHCDLFFDGETEMAWHIGSTGFEMRLSTYVPAVIKNGISALTQSLLNNSGLNLQDIDFFAIHPGGKGILEAIEEQVGITKKQNEHAYYVLRKFGNMSSPTVLFVLKEIWERLTRSDHHKRIISFGFGPGLTLESMILRVHNH